MLPLLSSGFGRGSRPLLPPLFSESVVVQIFMAKVVYSVAEKNYCASLESVRGCTFTLFRCRDEKYGVSLESVRGCAFMYTITLQERNMA